ncbi:MAG: ubiquinone biosynthesis regulatory protein kinase UbiB, partial [Neisseriaceae bacterium]|nr:ubiquinone biosynthesis regulatory protein kinase UbiB [Neisseriaceae bacterium]
MKSITRFLAILHTVYAYGLADLVRLPIKSKFLRFLTHFVPVPRKMRDIPLPERVRMALEHLGPIFVKFGQVLSTRPDILSPAYAKELARLQDDVPPFNGAIVIQTIENEFGKKIDDIYAEFDETPVASASIAQVHCAYLFD